MNHTPGPWIADFDDDGNHIVYAGDYTSDGEPDLYVKVRNISSFAGADADLIAAAPALLEACKAALDTILAFKGGCNIPEDCVKLCGDCQCVVPSLRAAIKLSEGQQ